MPVKSINIAIACDHVIFGKALKMYFTGLKDFNVLVTSADYDNLVTNLKKSSFEILLFAVVKYRSRLYQLFPGRRIA